MTENRVLRKIFGPKRVGVGGDLAPDITLVIKCMMCSTWVTYRREVYIECCGENLRERNHFEDLGVDVHVARN